MLCVCTTCPFLGIIHVFCFCFVFVLFCFLFLIWRRARKLETEGSIKQTNNGMQIIWISSKEGSAQTYSVHKHYFPEGASELHNMDLRSIFLRCREQEENQSTRIKTCGSKFGLEQNGNTAQGPGVELGLSGPLRWRKFRYAIPASLVIVRSICSQCYTTCR